MITPPHYCPDCAVWWETTDPCWSCGRPGLDTRKAENALLHPARSWKNAADWNPDDGVAW